VGGNFIAAAANSNNELTELSKGIAFFRGFGVESNMSKAVAIFTKYAEAGNALAKHESVSLTNKYGYGVKIDAKKAKLLF